MFEAGALFLKCESDESAQKTFIRVETLLSDIPDWIKSVRLESDEIYVDDGAQITRDSYISLPEKLANMLIVCGEKYFYGVLDYYSEIEEIHNQFILEDGRYRQYVNHKDLVNDKETDEYKSGLVSDRELEITDSIEKSSEYTEVKCDTCGDFFDLSNLAVIKKCPFCESVSVIGADNSVVEISSPKTSAASGMPWESYPFKIPLQVDLPKTIISDGADWIAECEDDNTFGLKPEFYPNQNKYIAALNLCKMCAGWFTFFDDSEKFIKIECLRSVVKSSEGEPMWYFDVFSNGFDLVRMIRECNPRYKDKLYDVENYWDLTRRLSQRSVFEKADCFEWCVDFLGEYIKYDYSHELSRDFYASRDSAIELVCYLRPKLVKLYLEDKITVRAYNMSDLSWIAAGLIRLGNTELGLELYKTVFDRSFETDITVEDRKRIVDYFLERLSQGYENEPYVTEEIAAVLEAQCQRFSDTSWITKIKLAMAKIGM